MSIAYDALVDQLSAGAYTEVAAKRVATRLLVYQQITDSEYAALMDMADALAANDEDGETLTRIVALEAAVQTLRAEVDAIKQTIAEGGGSVPEPEPAEDGSKDKPITAVRGMTYYRDKIYRDPEDDKLYKCARDNDTAPGTGVALAYLPHELLNIYFEEVVEA